MDPFTKEEVIKHIMDKTAVIGIVGLGYVGLPLLLSFIDAGFHTIGFDIDENKINVLIQGHTYLKHIGDERIFNAKASGLMAVTSDFSRVKEADALIICVPTPLNRYREPDLSFIIDTMELLKPNLRKGQIVSLESTTYPGTTEEELKPRLESCGFIIGKDIFLLFSPEREDPGNADFSTRTIPKVLGGATHPCLEVGIALYGSVIEKVIPVSSTKAAELTKLLENIYRAVNIGLANEMKIVADKMGIDIWEVIKAAATKPFGFTPFYPGPGWGGHCIPIDPFYLTWKAKEYGINTKFIELAGEINTAMPDWVVEKMVDALNDRKLPLKESKILIMGIAYKKNIDDMRESPAVKLMEILRKKGAILYYSDPYFPIFPKMREHAFDMKSLEVSPELLRSMDCVVITTDHDIFDFDMIQKNSKLIFDTRGRYNPQQENVVCC